MTHLDPLETLKNLPLLASGLLFFSLIYLAPRLAERFRLPGLLGLIAVGYAAGPNGLGLTQEGAPVIRFFADIGVLLLLFIAGLEINLERFKSSYSKSILFGALTFIFPFVGGWVTAKASGMSTNSSVLVGSLLASHSLIAYPVLQRLGLTQRDSVAVVVGGTMVTDIAALLVLAVSVRTHTQGYHFGDISLQIVQLLIYVAVVIMCVNFFGKKWLKVSGGSVEGQFLLIMITILAASAAAEWIHLEGIVGAFIVGLAINPVLKHGSEARREIEFVANTLFIPLFFVAIGLIFDPRLFLETITRHLPLTLGIVGVLIGAKWIAAHAAARLGSYPKTDSSLVWSLSLPQVAATLAAATVAYRTVDAGGARLIDEAVVNVVLVLLLVTAVLGPVLTERYGKKISEAAGG